MEVSRPSHECHQQEAAGQACTPEDEIALARERRSGWCPKTTLATTRRLHEYIFPAKTGRVWQSVHLPLTGTDAPREFPFRALLPCLAIDHAVRVTHQGGNPGTIDVLSGSTVGNRQQGSSGLRASRSLWACVHLSEMCERAPICPGQTKPNENAESYQ